MRLWRFLAIGSVVNNLTNLFLRSNGVLKYWSNKFYHSNIPKVKQKVRATSSAGCYSEFAEQIESAAMLEPAEFVVFRIAELCFPAG